MLDQQTSYGLQPDDDIRRWTVRAVSDARRQLTPSGAVRHTARVGPRPPDVQVVSKRAAPSVSAVAVMIVWAFMLFAALWLVGTYGPRTFPQSDEPWALYDSGSGIHVQWLWKTWAEHRIPLAKLIWKGMLEVTNYDFRAGNFLTVIGLALTSFGMIWTAARIRGRIVLADAFFPLALLNLGQATVFLTWWQVNQTLAPMTASALLMFLAVYGNHLELRHVAAIAAALILFVLCGPGGLPYAMAFAFWVFILGVMQWTSWSEIQRRQYLRISGIVIAALGLLAFYFVDYHPYFMVNDPPTNSSWPLSPGGAAAVTAFFEILGVSLGTATRPYPVLCGIGVLAFSLITAAVLAGIWLKRPNERWRAFSLAVILGAQAVLVCVVARSRAGMGLDYIYLGHYLTLVAPAFCCFYFVWEILQRRTGRVMQYVMMAVSAVLLPLNLHQGVLVGQSLQHQALAFEHDLRDGVPASVLAEHHFASDVVPLTGKLTQILRSYKENGIGIFKEMRDDPPSEVHYLSWDAAVPDGLLVVRPGPVLGGSGKSSFTYTIPQPKHVYALRLFYTYRQAENPWPTVRVYWRDSTRQEFTDKSSGSTERMFAWTVSGPDQPTWALVNGKIDVHAKVRTQRTLTVWIDASVDQIRIYPDSLPFVYELPLVELLTPPAS